MSKTQYPIYRRDLCHFYKVYSKTKALQICVMSLGAGINTTHAPLAFREETKESSEEEFNQAYNKVLKSFDQIVNPE